jgi:hypothetical protein
MDCRVKPGNDRSICGGPGFSAVTAEEALHRVRDT